MSTSPQAARSSGRATGTPKGRTPCDAPKRATIAEPRAPRARAMQGFTMLELLVAMGIFSMLGILAVWFMRSSLDIFYTGTRESAVYDRMDAVLPAIRSDLEALYVGDQFDAPPPGPTEDELMAGAKPLGVRGPTPIRLRSGHVLMKDTSSGSKKELRCPFMAFVISNASEASDPVLRYAGTESGPGAVHVTPTTVEQVTDQTLFLAPGGLMEVVWIAMPENPDVPSILTLYRGFRAPVGDPKGTLLDPENLNTPAKVMAACRPVARGLVHFGATWRRAFSSSWDTSLNIAGAGETDEYVGTTWDSTRGFDKTFPFFKGKQSQSDPSDDIFPAFVRLEVTLLSEGTFGYGKGDLMLREPIAAGDGRLTISDVDALLRPGQPSPRWLKIDEEWCEYDLPNVDVSSRKVRVRRGQRGTVKAPHADGSWIYIGTPAQTTMRLNVFRDRYATRAGGSR